MSPTITDEPAVELEDVLAGRLPERYSKPMQAALRRRLEPLLLENTAVLDVGAGRSPTIGPDARPRGCRWVGLDVSAEELELAEPGAYDAAIVHDITRPLLVEKPFDIVVSWQVLEHVERMEAALEGLRKVLRPGGTLLAQLSGRYALFAVAARWIPHALRARMMGSLLDMPPDEKFPTRYDACHPRALRRIMRRWTSVEIVPFYRGAVYLAFSRPVQRAYLGYETLAASRGWEQLATHYLVIATR